MLRAQYVVLSLLGGLLVVGCFNNNPGDDPQSATSTASTTGNSQSGSMTSATGTGATDSAPTMGTGSTSGTSDDSASTDVPCHAFICGDYPKPGCDVYVQDCPEGQKCAPYSTGGGNMWDNVKCVEVTGTDEPGDVCTAELGETGSDSCIEGAMCWWVDAEGVGACVMLCGGEPEAPTCGGPDFYCAISDATILNLCLPSSCDPLLQDCDWTNDACYPIDDSFVCAPDASGDQGQANDPCEFSNVCEPGLMCADAALVGLGCPEGSMGCCTPFCTYPDGACPNPDQQCVQYFDPIDLPADDPWLDIGFCGVLG